MPRRIGSPRKKIPVLEILEGNPGKKALHELDVAGIEALGEPFIPDHLLDDAQGCIEMIRQSMPDKVYSLLDTFLLSAFGMAWALHKKASIAISDRDFTLGTANADTCIKLLNKQALIMAALGDRLGLDPRSRAQLKLPNARQQRSKFDGLLGQSASLNSLSASRSPVESDKVARSV